MTVGGRSKSLEILYQTKHFLVVNKPPLCYSQPKDYRTKVRNDFSNTGQKTVLEILQNEYPEKFNESVLKSPFCLPKIVHRLDYQVSGAMILATSELALRMFNRGFQDPFGNKGYKLSKYYAAILNDSYDSILSRLSEQSSIDWIEPGISGTISSKINSQLAITQFKLFPRHSSTSSSPVAFNLITGKKHQLRRHSVDILGAAIVGDQKYQIQETHHQQNQIALHEYRLDIALNNKRNPASIFAPIHWGRENIWKDYVNDNGSLTFL